MAEHRMTLHLNDGTTITSRVLDVDLDELVSTARAIAARDADTATISTDNALFVLPVSTVRAVSIQALADG